MELSSKLLEQKASNAKPKNEEHMLIVMDKYTHEEHLFQPLQKNNKQFKIAVTFLTASNGIFKVTNENNNFFSYNHLLIKIVIYKSPYQLVLTRLKVWIVKLREKL